MILDKDIQEVLISTEQLRQRVAEMARQITEDYAGRTPIVIGILRGSFIFMADLVRQLDLPVVLDFMSASSYGAQTMSSGLVDIRLDLSEDIAGRDVIVIEDILDTGNTLSKIIKELEGRKPASIAICTLLDKPERRKKDIKADYVGFTIPDAFVVGYGLDYDQRYRHLPYIGVLKPKVYE